MAHIENPPVLIEAIQYTGSNLEEFSVWSNGKICEEKTSSPPMLSVPTKIGLLCVHIGTWIIKNEDSSDFRCIDSVMFNQLFREKDA